MRWFAMAVWLSFSFIRPVAAEVPISVIIEANETGPVIGSAQDFRQRRTEATRLDSVLAAFDSLSAPLTDLRELALRGDLLIVLAVDDLWDPMGPVFTNIDAAAPHCPRMFILGSFLTTGRRPSCVRTAVLAHEAQHAADFVAGRMPPVTNETTLQRPEQAFAILEVESRGFETHVAWLERTGCLDADEYGRTYKRSGLIGLRRLIATTYGLDRVPGVTPAVLEARLRSIHLRPSP